MAERIVNAYGRLFEVQILHHYWLDDASSIYDLMPVTRKTKLLLNYNSGTFIAVNPTLTTKNKIAKLGGVFRKTPPGFVVAMPKTTIIPDNEVFSFVLTITDAAFFNYTALTLMSRKIYELHSPANDNKYRYKENIPVYSNLSGVSRGTGPDKSLFLSGEIPASSPTDKVEYLNIKGGALVQLTSSQPGADTQKIHPDANNMPVFSHQNDFPAVVSPAGLTGTPEKGILLTNEIPSDVFGMIHITATNPNNADFNCTTAGIVKEKCPVFQIRFRNRSVFWRYLNKDTRAQIYESSTALPLTATGNAGNKKRKPTDPLIKVKYKDNDTTKRMEKIYTEIFE
jgi:hypothetical protein